MSSVSIDPKKVIALEFLTRAKDDLDKAKRTRIAYVQAAKSHGLSNQQIGDALDVSEARIRQILRAE